MCVRGEIAADLDDEFEKFVGLLESFQHLVDRDNHQHMGVLARQGQNNDPQR